MENSEIDPADILLQREAHLRQLRAFEKEDDAARQAADWHLESDGLQNSTVATLKTGESTLLYDSYLEHQRYYDDLKHIDSKFIDFGRVGPGQLVIEQDKSLGKGGFVWDAAFILAEYLVQKLANANEDTRVLELGCGTGICGLLVAKSLRVNVTLTDLDELMSLLSRNIARNFSTASIFSEEIPQDDDRFNGYVGENAKAAQGCVAGSVLVWGSPNCASFGNFDIIIGADVVASLYDPIALARTIHATCHINSKVYISFKERLSSIHRTFEAELASLFDHVELETSICSRNHNPQVQILIVWGKKSISI